MIDTHLYVLNHSVHKIHLDTFFAGGLDEVTGTSSEDIWGRYGGHGTKRGDGLVASRLRVCLLETTQ